MPMDPSLVFPAFLLSTGSDADSFFAAAILAPFAGSLRGRVLLIVLFGLCDGLASMFGVAAILPLGAILLSLVASRRVVLAAPWWVAAIPFLLCLDNMFAHDAGIGGVGAGLCSAGLAAIGMTAGLASWRAPKLAWSILP